MPDNQPQTQTDEPRKPIKIELNPTTLELSKAVIGCGGAMATALITGLFLFLTNSGIVTRIFSPSTPTLAPTITTVSLPTNVPIATITTVALVPTETALPLPTTTDAAPIATSTSTALNETVTPFTFAAGFYGKDLTPLEAGSRYPEGITKVFAIFNYQNWVDGISWRTEWYYNKKLIDQFAGLWRLAPNGVTYAWEGQPQGFAPGEWELRLYLGDALAQSGKFVVYSPPAGTPFFGAVQYARDFNDGQPIAPYGDGWFSIPNGEKSLAAFFHTGNMVKGMEWQVRWYRNGELIPNATQISVWSGDNNPESYTAVKLTQPEGLGEGTYTLKLLVNDSVVQLSIFIVQPALSLTSTPLPTPTSASDTLPVTESVTSYGEFTFAAGSYDTTNPVEPGNTFPQSTTQIVAIYSYQIPANSTWRDQWYVNGDLFTKYGDIWKGQTEGYSNSWLWDPQGLPPGAWELRSYINGALVQTGHFTIVPHAADEPGFGAIKFAEGIKDGLPVRPHAPRVAFAPTTSQLVAFFPGLNITPNTDWTAEWDFDGTPLSKVNMKGHPDSEEGMPFTARLNSLQSLPSGTYVLKLSIDGKIVQLATCVVEEG